MNRIDEIPHRVNQVQFPCGSENEMWVRERIVVPILKSLGYGSFFGAVFHPEVQGPGKKRADYLLRVPLSHDSIVIEVKRIGYNVEKCRDQALAYACFHGCRMIVITNGLVWRIEERSSSFSDWLGYAHYWCLKDLLQSNPISKLNAWKRLENLVGPTACLSRWYGYNELICLYSRANWYERMNIGPIFCSETVSKKEVLSKLENEKLIDIGDSEFCKYLSLSIVAPMLLDASDEVYDASLKIFKDALVSTDDSLVTTAIQLLISFFPDEFCRLPLEPVFEKPRSRLGVYSWASLLGEVINRKHIPGMEETYVSRARKNLVMMARADDCLIRESAKICLDGKVVYSPGIQLLNSLYVSQMCYHDRNVIALRQLLAEYEIVDPCSSVANSIADVLYLCFEKPRLSMFHARDSLSLKYRMSLDEIVQTEWEARGGARAPTKNRVCLIGDSSARWRKQRGANPEASAGHPTIG